MAAFSMQGFRTPKQERIYFQFVTRALELLQAEILLRRLGTQDFDQEGWEKKVVKIYKALQMMEKHKQEEPFLSKSFQELASHLVEKRKLNESSNLMKSTTKSDFSRFSLFEQMQAFDSIWQNPRGQNDSILTMKGD